MAYSPDEYTGNGSTTTYTITFPYLDNEDVKVTLDGAATTAFTIIGGGSQIQFSVAPGSGVAIKIYRETPVDVPEATFYTGASIRAVDLNENFLQNLYYAEETREVANEATTGVIPDGSIGTPKLADGAVTTAKLANDAVTADKLANNAVDAAAIQSGAVVAGKLGTAAVGNSNLADNSVTNAKLGDAAVNTAELADSSVTDAKIGDNVLTPYVSSINNGPLAGFRNAIINGNFDVWQRGDTYSGGGGDAYLTADRWKFVGNFINMSRQPFTLGQTDVPGEPTYFLRAGWTNTLSNIPSISQPIEGVRTFAGQQVTLSFYAMSPLGTYALPSIQLIQDFDGGSADVTTTVASNVALSNSWQKYTYTVTVPSISGKTISGTNDFISLRFNMPPNAVHTIDLAQVQLEPGPVATPFERRPIGVEQTLCYRYFWGKANDIASNLNGMLGIGSSFGIQAGTLDRYKHSSGSWPVPMRVAPNVTYTGLTGTNCTSETLFVTKEGFRLSWVATSTGLNTSNFSDGFVFVDAEL